MVHVQMLRLLARGEFPRGCKLPTEGELSARFGVSRPVLREALQRLKDEGALRSQRGSGTIVVRGPAPGAGLLPPVRNMAELLRAYEFRITVEGATAALAAERHTPATLGEIRAALQAAEAAIGQATQQLLADLNFDFHRAIARATANPYHLAVVEGFPNFIGADRVNIASFGREALDARIRRTLEEHGLIYSAIAARQPHLARAEMERHITVARDLVMERQALD